MFPLYEILLKEVKEDNLNSPLDDEKKNTFIKGIKKNATATEHEICYALIRQYQIENDNNPFNLPYEAKKFKRGIRFDIDKLPVQLQNILYKFIEKHLANQRLD